MTREFILKKNEISGNDSMDFYGWKISPELSAYRYKTTKGIFPGRENDFHFRVSGTRSDENKQGLWGIHIDSVRMNFATLDSTLIWLLKKSWYYKTFKGVYQNNFKFVSYPNIDTLIKLGAMESEFVCIPLGVDTVYLEMYAVYYPGVPVIFRREDITFDLDSIGYANNGQPFEERTLKFIMIRHESGSNVLF